MELVIADVRGEHDQLAGVDERHPWRLVGKLPVDVRPDRCGRIGRPGLGRKGTGELGVDLTVAELADVQVGVIVMGEGTAAKQWNDEVRRRGGCSASTPTITVGKFPGPPAFDKTTKTLNVPFGGLSNKVAVIDAATCNATDATGCGQTPGVVPVGIGTFFIAVSTAVNTVYAPATGYLGNGLGHTVAVIDGTSCNRTNHAGCAHPAAIVRVGHNPLGVAVSDKARTVYVGNFNNGDHPRTISMINEATCNGTHTAGCAGRHPTVTVGPRPYIPVVDARTGTVYMPDFSWADVSVINGSKCNAARTSGCHTVHEIPVGSQPVNVVISPRTSALYVGLAFPAPNGPLFIVKIKK